MSKGTILIVEDEAIVAEDLSHKLRSLGYVISGTTARGKDAVAMAHEKHPDLVLMDIRLQGTMDGVEAAGLIRQQCCIPVIFLTAHSDQATLQRAKLTEPFGYLLKPFEEQELDPHIQMAIYKHQIEQKLREQREWLRVTLGSIGDAVIATDTDGRITFLNPVATTLTGWPEVDAIGQPMGAVFKIINEKTRKPADNIVARALRENAIVALANHTALIARDGHEIPIEDSAAPIADSLGKVTGVVVVFHDVTERRRMEEARYQLAAIVESSADAIISKNLDGIITTWNKSAEQLFGYRSDEIIGSRIDIIIPPEHQADEDLILQRLRNGDSFNHVETLRLAKDGRRIPVSLTVSPIRDAEGTIIGASKIIRDITEQKKAEEQLNLQAKALQSAANAIVITDRNGTIEWVNEAFESLSGYNFDEAVGQPTRILKSGKHEKAFYTQIWKTVLEGRVWHGEIVNRRKNGELYDEEMTITPVRDQSGQIKRFVTIKQDITDRKRTQEILTRSNEELERLVANRTTELLEAVGELEHFSYTITHDMRAPLRAMRGYADLLLTESNNSQCLERKFLKRIASSAERMDQLIMDALNYTKLVQQELKMEPVDVGALLRDMVDNYPNFQQIKSQIAIADNMPFVMGNQAALTQCFSNLISNAIKFVQPGKQPAIRIWSESTSAIPGPKQGLGPQDTHPIHLLAPIGNIPPAALHITNPANPPESPKQIVRFWVEDNGIGIPAESREKVFVMFQRLSTQHEGTGIGLALVKKAAKRMGGRVGVESEIGTGSRFWLELERV